MTKPRPPIEICDVWQTIPLEQEQIIRLALYLVGASSFVSTLIAVLVVIWAQKWMERKPA